MSSPIQEGIDKLIAKGYVGQDILDVMVGIGWDAEDVRYAMNETYERRAKENQELARQRKEALDSVSASYDELKKKIRTRTVRFFLWDISWGFGVRRKA